MSRQTTDLTGQWYGTYSYPLSMGPTTPFQADITESKGHISGIIIEPNDFRRGETAEAILNGVRSGLSVDFTKQYHGAGEEYDNPVDYVGRLSEDGTTIAGVWSLLEWNGRFEMHRDLAEEIPLEMGAETVAD